MEGVFAVSILAMVSSAVANETSPTAVLLVPNHPDGPWSFMAASAHAWSAVTDGLEVCAKHLAHLSMHEGPSYANTSAFAFYRPFTRTLPVLKINKNHLGKSLKRPGHLSIGLRSSSKLFLAQQELPWEKFFRTVKISTQRPLALLSQKLCGEGG